MLIVLNTVISVNTAICLPQHNLLTNIWMGRSILNTMRLGFHFITLPLNYNVEKYTSIDIIITSIYNTWGLLACMAVI